MSTQVPLRCRCGSVRGVALDASPTLGTRLFCYCEDCQAFADFLDQPGVLDARGGTDIFHMAAANVRITHGADQLRCVRLSDKGLYRWHTECCKTPIGNMIGARIPFIGLVHSFMDHAGDGRSRDEALGRSRAFIFGEEGTSPLPPEARPRSPLRVVLRTMRFLFSWWRAGKRLPSVFFDSKTGAPRVAPRVLSVAERDALRQPSPTRASRAPMTKSRTGASHEWN